MTALYPAHRMTEFGGELATITQTVDAYTWMGTTPAVNTYAKLIARPRFDLRGIRTELV